MSSEKHANLGLHKWAPTDGVLRTEFNDNFAKLDEKTAEVVGIAEAAAGAVADKVDKADIGDLAQIPQATVVDALKDNAMKNDGVVSILEFSPVGSDWTGAFNQALALSKNVYAPKGRTFLVGDIEVGGQRIYGGAKIKKKASAESAFHIKGDSSIIEGLHFEGDPTSGQPHTDIKLGDGSKNIIIQNCIFNSPIYSAISAAVDSSLVGGGDYLSKSEGVLITNNIFKGYSRPMYLHSVSNITISNNIIRDTTFDAIRLRENDGFCLVNGNQFINIGSPLWADEQTRDAIDVYWSGHDLTISNNIINKTAYHGFDLKGVSKNGSYNSSRVIVTNNQIYGCRYSGLNILGDSDINQDGTIGDYKSVYGYIISGNIIQECNRNNQSGAGSIGDAAIHINQLSKFINITDNLVVSNYARGIYIHNATSKTTLNNDNKAQSHSVRVVGNMCVNNGYTSVTNSAGIFIIGTSYAIIEQNICENDTELPNAVQNVGIYLAGLDNGFVTTRSMIVRDNICRNNLNYQIQSDANTNRIDALAVFDGNIEEGTNANWRPTWQQQRRVLFGTTIPGAGEGTFKQGDIIYNTAPAASGKVGWVCTADGNPGTWKPFGAIDA